MQLFIRHKYIKISPAHKQKMIFMHNISREYSNIQVQKLKRTKEDTVNIIE